MRKRNLHYIYEQGIIIHKSSQKKKVNEYGDFSKGTKAQNKQMRAADEQKHVLLLRNFSKLNRLFPGGSD